MFDKKRFAKLLTQAVGDRSLNEYGRITGISAAHISRLTRAILEAPPNPQTIKQLTQFAENGVTYEDMMLAAGHIQPDWLPGINGMDPDDIGNTPRIDISNITD